METLIANIKTFWSKSKFLELIKFGIVGVLNTLVDFVIYTILVFLFNMLPSISQGISYSAGIVNSFILNRRWTFKQAKESNTKKQAMKFILVNGVSLAASSFVIGLLTTTLGFNVIIAKLIVTALTQVINYLGYKLIVFK